MRGAAAGTKAQVGFSHMPRLPHRPLIKAARMLRDRQGPVLGAAPIFLPPRREGFIPPLCVNQTRAPCLWLRTHTGHTITSQQALSTCTACAQADICMCHAGWRVELMVVAAQ